MTKMEIKNEIKEKYKLILELAQEMESLVNMLYSSE